MLTFKARPAVRDARPDDAEGIAGVHIQAWQVAYAHVFSSGRLGQLTSELAERAGFWRETIESLPPGRHVLVVEGDEGIVGFATAGPAREDDAAVEPGELYAIYVLPETWGEGVGQALMAEVLERLRAEGFREAILWVLEDNRGPAASTSSEGGASTAP